jgi:hypothetical protein
MIEQLKKYGLIVLLVISIAGNVFLLIKSKIEWNNYNTANSSSYSSSISSAMNLTFLNSYYQQTGSKVKWIKYIVEKEKLDDFLNSKDFMFSLFSKIITVDTPVHKSIFSQSTREFWVIIPEIVEEKK